MCDADFVHFGGISFTIKWKHWQGYKKYIVNMAIFAFFSVNGLLFVENALCLSTILLTSDMNSNTSSSFQTLATSLLVNFQNDASKENPLS